MSRKQVAALVGVAPYDFESGKLKGMRCIWGGRAPIRRVLYMAALIASRCNPALKVFHDRLQATGKKSKVVIVGGGVIGTSVAYHLTQLGWKEVVLLEQGQLGGGTSWHAAGLVGRLRTSNSMTRINKYTVELYSQLQLETGHSVGWKQVGSLIVAKSEDRMIQLRRTMAMAELFGVEAREGAYGRGLLGPSTPRTLPI
jgi:heterodisulfide reductase subunit A-like polyferredoxin